MNINRELRIIHEQLINAQQTGRVSKKLTDEWSMTIEMILITLDEEE